MTEASRDTPAADEPREAPSEASSPNPDTPGREAEEVSGSDSSASLAVLQAERDEYLSLAQRARADFENYRKRAVGESAEAERRGRATVAKAILPALDALERALEAADDDSGPLAQGVELVHRELAGALTRAGVDAYDPVGDPFDPSWHEAVGTRPAEDGGAGTIVETLDRGYRLDQQVLRPARVVVGE